MKTKHLFLLAVLLCGTLWSRAATEPAVIPPLNAKPGPEYADSVRMFQGIPAIERAPNGRLWAAWYGGGVTEDKHNYIILDTSGDDGKTWQRALILDPDRDGPVRAFDPCLWHDPEGKLWLFWAQRPDGRPADCMAISTTDSGNAAATWTEPRRVFEGILMNKPLVTADGRWLMPAAVWHSNDSARVFVSTDKGATFTRPGAASVPEKKDRQCDEHMLVQRKDGSLWMLVRTGYGIGESASTDSGKTWSDVQPSGIPHPVTRFSIRRLASGNLLLVRHNPPNNGKACSHLSVFLSADDGKTWQGGLLLDERNGVSYPDFVQAADGRVYVIYDFARTKEKEILMAVFREADVLAAKPVSPDARLRARINQATGINPGKAKPAKPTKVVTVPMKTGPTPELECSEGQNDVLVPGAMLFLDRSHSVKNVPAALKGKKFVRCNISGGRVVCRQPGVVYLLTPSAGRQRDSRAEDLLKHGFEQADIPDFMLFAGEANICSVFQKELNKDEVLAFDKWCVPVLAGTATAPAP
ncbi:MAG: sialidase family protein [Kiritimatiellaeota bacterium]|nr:sialidase family protein [Kiritimatiellota bacterium]